MVRGFVARMPKNVLIPICSTRKLKSAFVASESLQHARNKMYLFRFPRLLDVRYILWILWLSVLIQMSSGKRFPTHITSERLLIGMRENVRHPNYSCRERLNALDT